MFTTIMYPSTNKIRTRRIPWSNTLSSHILFFPLRHLKCSLAHCKDIQPVCSKEISLGCSLEGLMLKLKLQYFGYLMWRVDSLEKTLIMGGIRGRRKRGWQRMRWLDGITDLMDVRVGLWRKLSSKELMRLNCGVGEDSWESLGLQGDPTSPF